MTDPKPLHAYADNELTAPEAQAVRESLRHDPAAAAEVDAVLNLKDLLAKHSVRHESPDAWRACVGRLNEMDKARRVEGFVGRYAWALCAGLFLFILSGRVAMKSVQGESVRAASVASFGRSAPRVSEANRARAEFYDKILGEVGRNLDPNEVEIGNPVRGGVHDLIADSIPMRDRKGDMLLTRVYGMLNVQETAPAGTPGLDAGVVEGENCVIWHRHGETWILAGERSIDSLSDLAARLRPQD